jgi:hypothetical protein
VKWVAETIGKSHLHQLGKQAVQVMEDYQQPVKWVVETTGNAHLHQSGKQAVAGLEKNPGLDLSVKLVLQAMLVQMSGAENANADVMTATEEANIMKIKLKGRGQGLKIQGA